MSRADASARSALDGDPGAPHHPAATLYLHERYSGSKRRSRLLPLYYSCKPRLPRRMQLRLRRIYALRQQRREFPSWPVEPVQVRMRHAQIVRRMREQGLARMPIVGDWPQSHRFAFILTHDVEGPAGIERIEPLLEIERKHGFVSSWNFVAEEYPIPPGTFERLRGAECEIGLHGITHDGKLFQSRARFEHDLPKIHAYLREWDAAGFRSPATHRRAEWMHELGCLYDSSFPDTDPFEPQSGGCCSILPFMFGETVELPITLVQDHTLLEILGERTPQLWVQKCEWIIAGGGLINLITHPDYIDTPERLRLYDDFLSFLAGTTGGWHALPREVARWWQMRAHLSCEQTPEQPRILGQHDGRARLLWAALDGERLQIES
jgi:peptidoglycan/xylan/chitin deacetylase (PgdA/CDA1 family)